MKNDNLRLKQVILGGLAVVALASARPLWAQLPGLPTAEAPAGEAGEGPRPGETRPVIVNPTGPIRGSLFRQAVESPAPPGYNGGEGTSRGQANVNLIAIAPVQPKRYQKNDVVTVVISEISDSETNGAGASKKTQDFDLAIKQFLQLALSQSGIPTVGTVNNPSSLPEIKFNYSNDRSSNASQQRTDSFTARVSATIVDVKPNGTLVIEAVKNIVIDKEVQVFKLSGICRAADIQIDNTVLSTQLANLTVSKQTTGNVHEGTKTGWLNQWLDKVSPF